MSNKNIPDWMFNDNSKKESKPKSALDSFANSLIDKANQMKRSGATDEEVGKAFNSDAESLKSALKQINVPQPKCACGDEVSEQLEQQKKNADDAAEAFNSLYNKKTKANFDDVIKSGKNIHSAKSARTDISNEGGPKRQLKYNNSLWDSEILQRAAKEMDNGEKLKLAKQSKEQHRQSLKAESYESLISGESLKKSLNDVDVRKNTNVKSSSTDENINYSKRIPKNGISIFDKDFNIDEKTAGEKTSEEVKKIANERQDAKSKWTDDVSLKSLSSKNIFDRMIDKLSEQKDKKGK
jgi:hypothetical protein